MTYLLNDFPNFLRLIRQLIYKHKKSSLTCLQKENTAWSKKKKVKLCRLMYIYIPTMSFSIENRTYTLKKINIVLSL